ncbi:hypothetical protein [Clostridium novyi]|uniref:Conserved protein, putative n=1 Tax=Clostridium novyi (strain NT) TaxID=386415 RepID=A0PYZ7_CLONN|nr:hypothetical protein [Clostridium novyi]ABK60905.1 conserved protein, putative [Clostridium novyi NT]
MSNNKTLKVFSSTAVAGMIAAAMMSSQAFAAVDAYSVKVGDAVYKYDKVELEKSFLDSKAGEKSALYEDFTKKLAEAKGFYGFNDNKNGLVDYSSIEAKFLEAKGAGQKFDVNAFTESKDAKIVEAKVVKKAVVKDGKVEYVDEVKKEDEKAELSITSVEALNLKQVKVNFNKAVTSSDKKDDIEQEDNYKIFNDEDKEVTDVIDKVELDKSGKFAIINFKNSKIGREVDKTDLGIKNQEEYKIEFEDNITGKEETKKVFFKDFEVLKVESITVVGSDSIKVKFSKPVKPDENMDNQDKEPELKADDFEINNDDISVSKVELCNNNTEAIIKLGYTLTDGQKIKVKVKGQVGDFNGFEVAVKEENLVVKKNLAKPEVVGYKNIKKGEVTLIFNEEIKFDGDDNKEKKITDDSIYHTNTTNKASKATIDGKELKVEFENYELPAGSANIHIKADFLKTLWNQKNEKIVAPVNRKVDDSELKVNSIEQDKDDAKLIEVKFNKEVDTKKAEDTSNYKLVDENGRSWSIDNAEKDSDNKKKVKIKTSKKLDSGKYTLTIKDVEDVDGKAIKETKVSFNANEKDPRTSKDIEGKVHVYGEGNKQKIIVDFDTKMKESSIRDIKKYSLECVSDSKYFKGEKSTVLIDDLYNSDIKVIQNGHKVELQVPYKDNKDDSYDLAKDIKAGKEFRIHIGKVEDASGNVNPVELIAKVEKSDTVGIKREDGEAQLKAISTDKIQVVFDDELKFKNEDLMLVYGNNGKKKIENGKVVNEVKVAAWDPESKDGKTVVTMTLEKDGDNYEKYDDDKLDHVLTYDGKYKGEQVYLVTTEKEDDIKSENKYDAKLQAGISEAVVDHIAPAIMDNSKLKEASKDPSVGKNEHVVIAKVDETPVVDGKKLVVGTITLTFEEDINPNSVTNNTFKLDEHKDYEDLRIVNTKVDGNKVILNVAGKLDEDDDIDQGFTVSLNQPISDKAILANKGKGNEISELTVHVGNSNDKIKDNKIIEGQLQKYLGAGTKVNTDKKEITIDAAKKASTVQSIIDEVKKDNENLGLLKFLQSDEDFKKVLENSFKDKTMEDIKKMTVENFVKELGEAKLGGYTIK